MSLPGTIPVRISSESADLISLTPVVMQEMKAEELVGLMLPIARKDAGRICSILARGTLVSGASRLRWAPLPVDADEMALFLTRYPDPDPSRPFTWHRCHLVLLGTILLPRDTASKRRWLHRSSFWQVLAHVVRDPLYLDYSYGERSDVFRAELAAGQQREVRGAADLLAYPSLAAQIRAAELSPVDLYVQR